MYYDISLQKTYSSGHITDSCRHIPCLCARRQGGNVQRIRDFKGFKVLKDGCFITLISLIPSIEVCGNKTHRKVLIFVLPTP